MFKATDDSDTKIETTFDDKLSQVVEWGNPLHHLGKFIIYLAIDLNKRDIGRGASECYKCFLVRTKLKSYKM